MARAAKRVEVTTVVVKREAATKVVADITAVVMGSLR